LVDDHGIVRAGLRSLLDAQPDLEVVGEAANGQEAVEKAIQLLPDLVLMDLTLPKVSGLEATKEIKRQAPQVRILILTIHDNEEYFFPVLSAGASGYVLKEAEPAELLTAIRGVHAGGTFLSPKVARVVLGGYLRNTAASLEVNESYQGLSPREHQVIRLAAEGGTNREIAEQLCLSVKTVEKHKAKAMEKLGLRCRADLVKYAIRKGLLNIFLDK